MLFQDEIPLDHLTVLLLEAGQTRCSDELLVACQSFLQSAAKRLRILAPRFVGAEGPRWTDETWEQLTCDFYADRVLPHWAELLIRAKSRDPLEGLFRRMAKQFLEDRRRSVDPHGTALFRKLKKAVELGVTDGRLALEPHDRPTSAQSRVRILALTLGSLASKQQLAHGLLRHPNRDTLRRNLGSRGTAPTEILKGLWAHFAALDTAAFVFGDLVDAAEEFVGRGEEALDVDEIRAPSVSPESDELDAALAPIRAAIAKSGLPEPRSRLLVQLLEAMVERADGATESDTEVAERLGLSKQRLSDLRQVLREIVGPLRIRILGLETDSRVNRPSAPL